MGLDLSLIFLRKDEELPGEGDWVEFCEQHGLAYGCKTWEIYYELRDKAIEGDWLYEISPTKWGQFIKHIENSVINATETEDLNIAIPMISNAIDEYQSWEVDPARSENWEDEPAVQRAWNLLEDFNDEFSDITPTLGEAWEAHAILEFYNVNSKVLKHFADGDRIYLVARY